jgi:Fic family protein
LRTFDYSKLGEMNYDREILSLVSQIHEHKGRQELFLSQRPEDLERLIEIAKIQSTEASNEIEGIRTTNTRLKQLCAEKTAPRNRNEKEILGYRDVLNLIHESFEFIPLRSNYILQLHRDLYKYTGETFGGSFKNCQNYISATDSSGNSVVLFTPLAPYETPSAIEELCNSFNTAIDNNTVDPLILIPVFVHDFLCIPPFNDGNGRMSRLLTLLMLYRAGYIVGKYISIEHLIEKTKETYYECLQESSLNWHENENNYVPFVQYMLGVVVAAYRDFSDRVETMITSGLSKPERVAELIRSTYGEITKSQIMEKCPDISRITVDRALTELMSSESVIKIGGGRYTKYVWNR